MLMFAAYDHCHIDFAGTAPYCADIECTPIDVTNAGESLTADPLIHGEQIRIRCDYGEK